MSPFTEATSYKKQNLTWVGAEAGDKSWQWERQQRAKSFCT